jgi:hypothetical protein
MAAPVDHATSGADGEASADPLARAQVFRAGHAGDWGAAGLILAVPVATGADLWHQMGWASEAGRLLFLALALLGLGGAAFYVAARIAVRVVVAPEGIAAARGPWRNALAWHEIARLRERTEAVERQPVRWLVAEARDGRRLQVHEDVVGDYPLFRATVYAAHQRWRALGAVGAADGSGAFGPIFLARETTGATGWLAGVALAAAGAVVYLWALLAPLRLVALALGVVALALGGCWLLARTRRRSFALDDAGIEAWSRLPIVRLDWHEITRVERRRARWRVGVRIGGWVSDRMHALVAGRADWTGDQPWPRRAPETLVLRGGGRRLALPLHRLREPEAVLARVTQGMEAARQADQAAVERAARTRATARLPRASAATLTPGGTDEVIETDESETDESETSWATASVAPSVAEKPVAETPGGAEAESRRDEPADVAEPGASEEGSAAQEAPGEVAVRVENGEMGSAPPVEAGETQAPDPPGEVTVPEKNGELRERGES